MQDLYKELIELLQEDQALIIDDKLNKGLIIDRALKLDPALIKLLLTHPNIKKQFFVDIESILVFDKVAFQRFVNAKNFLPDSYTQYKNKIGLSTDSDHYITDSREVVLAWPHKDCVLEGGQTKEDAKRNEIFYNTTLAPDEIDVLTAPKVLTNWKRYDKDGETIPTKISKADNLIIKGNNLLALHTLKEKYRGQVKLIYIDPPFNTGNDSFSYNDSFNHSTWLTFMKNRLEVARELLSNSGTICISIDQNEVSYILTLMDEIFDKQNRRNIVTIKRGSVTGAKVINPGVVNVSEFVIIYSKQLSSWKPNRVYRAKLRDDRYNNVIINFEEDYSNWKFAPLLDIISEKLKIKKSQLKKELADNYENVIEEFIVENANRIIRFASLDVNSISQDAKELKKASLANTSKLFKLEREGKNPYFVYCGNIILFAKDRILEIDGKQTFSDPISDIWDDVLPNDLHNEGGVELRKGKKPEKLLERILSLCSNENDIILDYHLGSGTTCAVAQKMNRRYIGLEQLDYGQNDSVIRLKNVINGEQSGISKSVNWKGGGSFIYAELMQSNQNYISQIQEAKTTNELLKIWEEMQATAFISYKVLPENINKEIKDFEALAFEEQQRFLVEILDKNLLYVNKSEINDTTHKVSNYDKEMNAKFYSM
jgi:adenine-specific DNA-methyltransferase